MKIQIFRSEEDIYLKCYHYVNKNVYDQIVINKKHLNNTYRYNKVERTYQKLVEHIQKLQSNNLIDRYGEQKVAIKSLKGREYKIDPGKNADSTVLGYLNIGIGSLLNHKIDIDNIIQTYPR